MTAASSDTNDNQNRLTLSLASGAVSASYLSSVLRVMQATLREVAQTETATRARFERRPSSVLLVSRVGDGPEFELGLFFAHPIDGKPLEQLSAMVFESFLVEFARFVRQLPQPSLFGGAARGSPRETDGSELARRMDQVHRELRRAERVTLGFAERTVRIEGESMEIT